MFRPLSRLTGGLVSALALVLAIQGQSADQMIEEVVVSARLQSESLQDVPVTIAAMTEVDLDRYNITSLVDAAKLVPNMVIAHGGSGNGANLRLRGVGSSSISAAFDHSVAINLDGVVVNRGRFIHNSYLDMRQIEVLKGPQSLYFGKSSTAGVVSIATNDPGQEFEIQASGGLESEHAGTFGEFIISSPITDSFGARLAIGFTKNDELFDNYAHGRNPVATTNGSSSTYGDESLNTRLTLVWSPLPSLELKLKYSYSEYENNGGGTIFAESLCPEGSPQRTAVPAATAPISLFQPVDDCRLNGNSSKVNLNPGLRAGLPQGFDDGVHGLEQETDFLSLTIDWDITDTLTLTSVTGYVDLSHWELDDYSYGSGVFGGVHNNVYESLSQEFRIASTFEGAFNFQAGFYWQQIEQEFDAYQYAFNLPVVPQAFANILAGGAMVPSYAAFVDAVAAGRQIVAPVDPNAPLVGADPFTGNQYDYNKDHFLDTDVISIFFAAYWDLNDVTELTFGARYTEEDKEGYILVPYLHTAARLFGWGVPERIDGLEFDDSNLSPEIAINFYLTDEISLFAAYKEGFKSGGIDNSALPTAALGRAAESGDFGFLIYDSEEAKGFEVGMKGSFLDGAMRINATVFSYDYSDLQVQLFNASQIQFFTSNASGLDTRGVEFDLLWNTGVEGLSMRTAWAWTDATVAGEFINATGEDLDGLAASGNAEITGFAGVTWNTPVFAGWQLSLSADARYTGDYPYTQTRGPFEQDAFWLLDTSVSLTSGDGAHQINLIGRNMTDEIWAVTAGAIPGRCANFDPTRTDDEGDAMVCAPTGANSLDQAVTTALGRTLSLQYRFTFRR